MMTIRQVREVVAALRHQLPDAPTDSLPPEQAFGKDATLEATFAAALADSLEHPEEWPSRLAEAMLPHMMLRLLFLAECLRQTEAAHPEFAVTGLEFQALLKHWMVDMWPLEGRKWMMATFGPRRMPR